jgi:hypothetical protein
MQRIIDVVGIEEMGKA